MEQNLVEQNKLIQNYLDALKNGFTVRLTTSRIYYLFYEKI